MKSDQTLNEQGLVIIISEFINNKNILIINYEFKLGT
jgi:hypothetical protein